MTELGLLTAVVPFHNFSKNLIYLEELLESVLSSEFKILVVCDYLEQSQFDYLCEKYQTDSRILFRLVNYRSAAKSRNAGLSMVSTPWVVFWDCDDRVYENSYLKVLHDPQSEDMDLIIGQMAIFDHLSNQILSSTNSKTLEELATYPAFTRVIYRKSFLAQTEFPDITLCEDQCFLALLLAQNPQFYFTHEILYNYRVNNPDQSSNNIFNINSHLLALKYLGSIQVMNIPRNVTASLKILQFRLLLSMLKRSRAGTGTQFLYMIKKLIVFLISSPWLIKYSLPKVKKTARQPEVFLVGGLGNQLFQYVYMLAKMGSSNFRINVNLGNPRVAQNSLPDLFSFNVPEGMNCSSGFLSVKTRIFNLLLRISSHGRIDGRSNLFFSIIDLLNVFYSVFTRGTGLLLLADGVGFFEEKRSFHKYRYFIGCFHSYRWKENIDLEMLRDILVLRKNPDWLHELSSEVGVAELCAVHIRRGDYVGISNLGYLSMSYYERLMRSKIEDDLVSGFLIFTDDIDFVRENLAKDLLEFSRIVQGDPDNSAANLVAMSLCKSFILSNSSFSWWGANLAFNHSTRVAAPKYWYADGRNPRDVFPSNWLLVGDEQ